MRMMLTALLGLCLSSGCGLIMIGGPVEKQDLASEDDAAENLKAIRALLSEQATRLAHPVEPAPSSLPAATGSAAGLTDPRAGPRPVPSSSPPAGMAEVPAKLPWAPTAPDRPAVPDRSVPAYTTPAPVGPDQSGSIRCVPDGMGGQRCAGR